MPWLIFFRKEYKEAEPRAPNSPTLPAGRGFHTMSFLSPRSPTADPGPLGNDDAGMGMEWEVSGKVRQFSLGS